MSGAFGGTLNYRQPIWLVQVGWEAFFANGLYFDFGMGAGFLSAPAYSLSIGGSAIDALSIMPGGQATLDQSISQVRAQVDSAVSTLRDKVHIIPAIIIGIGWAFNLG